MAERLHVWAVALAIAVVASPIVGTAVADWDGERSNTIDECTTINESGRYTLTTDIDDSEAQKCIQITASDVVLDGSGHTVDGRDGTGSFGIEAGYRVDNVSVRNVVLRDWETGVVYRDVDGGEIRQTLAYSNVVGLALTFETEDVTVRRNTATNNVVGIDLYKSDDNVVRQNTANSNHRDGIQVGEGEDNVVRRNTANYNRINGILLRYSDDNRIVRNVANGNTDYGIQLFESDDNKLRRNTALNNGVQNLLMVNSSGNRVAKNDFGEERESS
jgi:parallel beta-helix repeat protein